jgi:16S rRNA (adenine1518-N6/adenine1519-N6)-dimethyltransferase
VSVQAQARVRVVRHVPSAAFYPRPKVDSVVMRLDPLPDAERPVPRTDVAEFVRLVQAGFRQPRKTLANSLADGLGIPKAEAQALLERAGLDPSRRPQQLTVADWAALFRTRRAP